MANVLDKIGSNIKKKIEENQKEHTKEVKVDAKTELLVVENSEFDYKNLENDIAEYLKKQELSIKNIVAKAYTEIGEILSEAQEKLANHHMGVFEKWYESLGFKKDKVYRLISRYKLVLANCENRVLIENLPLSLSYEIAKESCPEDLRSLVLDGEIKTLKEFQEAKKDGIEEKKFHIIKAEEFKSRVHEFEKRYEVIRKNIFENFNNIEEERKSKLYKEIRKFEKNLEKIFNEI